MTQQPDPAIVQAIIRKHLTDTDKPAACETCVLAHHIISLSHPTRTMSAHVRQESAQ